MQSRWRDPDDLPRTNGAEVAEYKQAGSRTAAQCAVSDVGSAAGAGHGLRVVCSIEPAVTIYSGSATPNPAFAPFEALRTLRSATDDFARQIIESAPADAAGAMRNR
jgi:hypothetical protein